MRRVLVVASCLLGVAAANDWYWLNPLPNANDLTAVWFIGDTGYVSGPSVIKTTNAGADWFTVGGGGFTEIQFPKDAHIGYAAGRFGVSKTTDGGATWTYQPLPYLIEGICFPADNDTGYVLYDNGDVGAFKTTAGLDTWTTLPFPAGFSDACDIAFTDAQRGWVVGSGGPWGGFVCRTTDGGQTWVAQDTGAALGERLSVCFLPDGQTGYTCGYFQYLRKTTDGGEHWASLPFPEVYGAYHVSFPSGPDTGFVIGEISDRILVFRTTDGGQTWDSLPGTAYLNAVHFPGGSRVGYLAGPQGMLAKTTDAGTSWTNFKRSIPGTESAILCDVEFPVDEATGFAVGEYGLLLRTTDGGADWSRTSGFDTLGMLLSIDFANADTGYIAGFARWNEGRVWRTFDGGASWDTVFAAYGSEPCDVQFPHGTDTGHVVDRYNMCVWRTTDGGDSWVQSPTLGGLMTAIDFPTPQVGYVVGEGGVVFKTTDAGTTWQYIETYPFDWRDVCFPAGPDTGFICGGNGAVQKTTDGGANWVDQNFLSDVSPQSISFPSDAQAGYIAGEAMIAKTTDGGTTWRRDDAACSRTLGAIQFPLNAATGYAVGAGGTILKTGTGGGTVEESPKSHASRPRSSATIVRGVLFLPASCVERRASSVLLDAAGRKVAGLHGGVNDVSRLSPGVYFVREAQAVRKVIVQ